MALQALTEYGGAVSGGSGGTSALARAEQAIEALAGELGRLLDFAVTHPAESAFGIAIIAVIAVAWAVSLR